jgi:Tol biopolymer transport system component
MFTGAAYYRPMSRTGVVAVLLLAALVGASPAGSAGGYRVLEMPAWSPDGTRIAWASQSILSNGPAAIWTANPDGSSPRQLIGGLMSFSELVWPQPGMLLYEANDDVVRISPSGARKTVLTGATGIGFATDTRGDVVATSCFQCQASPILIGSTTTGKRSEIGGKGTSNADPAFSPDGSRLVFTRNGDLWIADRDGTHTRLLKRGAGCASWSPAGNVIAYFVGSAFYAITPAGTHARLLLASGPGCQGPPASFAWSPDGKTIAYGGGNARSLTLLDVATGHTTALKKFTHVAYLAWSPDSSRLLVTAPADCPSLWRVDADGSHAAKLVGC